MVIRTHSAHRPATLTLPKHWEATNLKVWAVIRQETTFSRESKASSGWEFGRKARTSLARKLRLGSFRNDRSLATRVPSKTDDESNLHIPRKTARPSTNLSAIQHKSRFKARNNTTANNKLTWIFSPRSTLRTAKVETWKVKSVLKTDNKQCK